MMKIHKTQNLSSLASNQSTNISMPKQVRCKEYSSASNLREAMCTDSFIGMSFKAKKPNSKKALNLIKKPVEAIKKGFGERVADKSEKMLASDSFGKILGWTETQEVLVQAGSALIVCSVLRPGTLALFPGDKNKQDFLYAAAHSISSGWWGFGVATLFTKPPTNGVNHVLDNIGKYVKDSRLKEMYPHLDLKSICKEGSKERKPVAEWLDLQGRKFIADTKNVKKVFKPLHVSEVSNETLMERVKDIDLNSIRNAEGAKISANLWKDKAGNNVKFALEDMFICVQPEGKSAQYYPLKFVNSEILKEVHPELDLATVVKDGKNVHPDFWKTVEGKEFKFDNDEIFISSVRDSGETIPLVTGLKREEKGKMKDICFQDNARNADELGTEISTEMLEAADVNTIMQKVGAWLPDIIVTYPRAAATIAVLPFILKNVFGLEKSQKPKEEPAVEKADNINEDLSPEPLDSKTGKVVA